MAHVRQSIRDNVVTTVTGLSTTGSSVFRTRIYPLETGNLPGLCVYTQTEDSGIDTLGSRNLTRTVDVLIEAAMATDVTRGGYAKDCLLTRSEFEFSDEGDRPIVMGRLTYAVQYRTAINNAQAAT